MNHLPEGVRLHRGFFDAEAQVALAREIAAVIAAAPLYTSTMPKSGAPMSVRMTNCGDFGWYSDKSGGYRYDPRHPLTGTAWPPIPAALLSAWAHLTDYALPPQACLVNVYESDARMGL